MKLIVTLDCEANGLCVGIAPDVFELDDDDQLTVHEEHVVPTRRAQLEEAARMCPRAALRLTLEPHDE
jgi:ferredoxin